MRKFRVAQFMMIFASVSLVSHAALFYPGSVAMLISAINTANSNNQDDVIDLRFKTITLLVPDNGQTGLPIILSDSNHSLTIKNGNIQRRNTGRTANFRLIDLGDNATLNLERVTLQNGRITSGNLSGGAIYVRANAMLKSISNSTFSFNAADGNGGAISLSPTGKIGVIRNSTFSSNSAAMGGAIFLSKASVAEITDSSFSDNYAATLGGAIAVFNQSSLTRVANTTFLSNKSCGSGGAISVIMKSTLSQMASSTAASNSAPLGGALHVDASTAGTISNSTFSKNSGVQGGGINIRNISKVDTISNSTFAENSATGGGGALFISTNSKLLHLNSTIVATDAAKVGPDIQGAVGSESYNLIGDNVCSNIVAGNTNANKSKVGTPGSLIDPLLGPLKDNGGPTLTRLPRRHSPAINMGSNSLNFKFDQRGITFPRTVNIQTDIGACEVCNCGAELVHMNPVETF